MPPTTPPQTPILLALSGGADSTALLYKSLEEQDANRFIVVNFNHKWGPFGDEAAAFVQAQAQACGVPFYQGTGSGKTPHNPEENARNERYTFFQQVAGQTGATILRTGHNATDRLETMFMRMGKGSGLTGLTSLRAAGQWRGLRIERPLITQTRSAIREWLKGKGHAWLDDPSNPHTTRGRVRALIPLLEQAGLPESSLLASLDALERAEDALQAHAHTVFHALQTPPEAPSSSVLIQPLSASPPPPSHHHPASLRLALSTLRSQPEEIALRALKSAILEACPAAQAPRTRKRQNLLNMLKENDKGTTTLGGCRITWP